MARRAPAGTREGTGLSGISKPIVELRGEQVAVIGALLALAGLAWVATDLRMAGMDAGPGTDPGAFGFYTSTWVVMMAAMMFPAIAPTVLAYRDLQRERRGEGSGSSAGNAGFIVGYLGVWVVAGLLGYVVLKAGRSLDGGLFAWDRAGRWAAAGVLLAAALYEFTPRKNACLSRCRSARWFLRDGWRAGRDGGLRMGLEYGAWCLGCCWALMAALFALGAMSLAWMALISVLIAAERLLPWRALATGGVASVLAALAIAVAATPASVPALTIPGSPSAKRAMGMSFPLHVKTPKPMRMPKQRSRTISPLARSRSSP
jgi:predicted metal-binding membrane protein